MNVLESAKVNIRNHFNYSSDTSAPRKVLFMAKTEILQL